MQVLTQTPTVIGVSFNTVEVFQGFILNKATLYAILNILIIHNI